MIVFLLSFVFFTAIQKDRYFFPDREYRHQTLNRRIPENLVFAGEVVHFRNKEAYKAFYNELRLNTQRNSSTRLLLRDASIWLPVMKEILEQHKVPSDFQYVAMVESNLRNMVSPRGAVGYWQLKEDTGRENGLEINDEVDERYDPIRSTYAACRFFKQTHRHFGSWTVTAAAYNRGITGIERAFENQNKTDYYDLNLNKETSKYIYKLLAIKDMMENPAKYGLTIYHWKKEPVRIIKVTQNITDLTAFAAKYGVNHTVLKIYNPWLLANTLTIKRKGSSYTIQLPYRNAPALKDTLSDLSQQIPAM